MAVFLALAQVVQDFVHIAQLHHHRVGDDEGAGDALHLFQVLDGILLKIDAGRHLEPLHVDPPLGDALFVDEVHRRDVLGHAVLAVGAAAQRQGRRVGIIDVADGALGGRAVHNDSAHAHGHAVFIGDLHVAGMNDGGVAQAAQLQHLVGVIKALLLAVYNKVGQHRGKLFLRQRMVFVRRGDGRDEDLRFFGHLQAGLLGDPVCRFAHQRAVNALAGVREHEFRQLFRFFLVEEVAVVGLHIVFERFGDLFVHDDGLLGSADHAVVEGLGHHQVGAGAVQVRGFFNIARHVARADAQRRFTAAVSGLYHAGAARGQDGGHAGVVHQRPRRFDGRRVDPLDAVLRRAGLHSGLIYDARSLGRALLRGRVETEDDGVARFHGDQAFEQRGGGGVGGGGDACDNAYRLGHFHIALHLVLVQHAHGLFLFDVVPDILGGKHILDDLVLVHAAAGFLHGHAGQLLVLVKAGQRHLVHDVVDLFLIQRQEFLQSCLGFFHQAVDHFVHGVLHGLHSGGRSSFGGRLFLCHQFVLPKFIDMV